MSSNSRGKPGPETPALDRFKSLSEDGSNVTVNPDVKASAYVRSGKELVRSANNYYEDGNLESAFVLYTRYLTIFLERIRHHPGYKDIPAMDRKLMTSYCSKILPKAESLREQILQKYDEEHKEYKKMLQKMCQEKLMEESAAKLRTDVKKEEGGEEHKFQLGPGMPDPQAMALAPPAADVIYGDLSYVLSEENNATSSQPRFDRTTKPMRLLSPMSSGLREVVVPGDLINTFLRCAEKNTSNNVETCGILTGRILQGELVVTDLIIPKQDGTSDSCMAKAEEEIHELQENLDLITIGWIHTHPSQTAFLSSIDMHNQFGYQQMMPEAIAIVCSPRKDQVGTFTLNPIEGMDIIGKCRQTGFHTHPNTSSPLFIDAQHHKFDTSRKVNVHDLRFSVKREPF